MLMDVKRGKNALFLFCVKMHFNVLFHMNGVSNTNVEEAYFTVVSYAAEQSTQHYSFIIYTTYDNH